MGNNLIKSNPKTIADLNINWEFSYKTYLEYEVFAEKFKKLNPKLENYNIINNIYTFSVVNVNRSVNVKDKYYYINTKVLNFSKICTLFQLFFELDFLIAIHQFKNNGESLKLDSIRKASDYQFVIYLK
jgi:hypothetical protein